jgi:hypothetical protein
MSPFVRSRHSEGMDNVIAPTSAPRRRGTSAWHFVAVAVIGLVAPVFVSTPLSAADTQAQGTAVEVSSVHESAE